MSDYLPESAMAIVAHPDDIEFGCAGTMARWAKLGVRTCYVLCTSGEVGIDTPGMTKEKATEIREAEALAAAEIAGVKDVIFLREPDGLLQPTLDLRRKLVREIRRFHPEVIITFDPGTIIAGDDYINHPDHRAASIGAVDAAFPASGQPLLYPEMAAEGLRPHKVRKVYIVAWGQADTWVNISQTIDIKIAALRAHASQMGDWDPTERIKEWAAGRAKGKEMDYAEGYKVVTLLDDEEWGKLNGKG